MLGATTAGAVNATYMLWRRRHDGLLKDFPVRLFSDRSGVFLPMQDGLRSVPVNDGASTGSYSGFGSFGGVDLEGTPSGRAVENYMFGESGDDEYPVVPVVHMRTISTQTASSTGDSTTSSTSSAASDAAADEVQQFKDTSATLFNLIGLEFLKQKMYPEALDNFQRSADHGYAKAQYNLGMCHLKGLGTRVNHGAAAKAWEMAASQNHGQALYQLAVIEYHRSNLTAGMELMQKAGAAGVKEAAEFLDRQTKV